MYDMELYHHGIRGQKWGVRRFQNKDGSLTKLGQKRVDKAQKKAAKVDKKTEMRPARGPYSIDTKFESIAGGRSISRRKSGLVDKASGLAALGLAGATAGAMIKGGRTDKTAMFTGGKKGSPAEKMLNSTKNVSDVLSKGVSDRANKRAMKEASKIDLSKASDQEIRDYVNRYNLEKQFRQITAEQYGSGRSKAKDIIDTIGAAAGVGASIAGIIVAYNQIKNGGGGG